MGVEQSSLCNEQALVVRRVHDFATKQLVGQGRMSPLGSVLHYGMTGFFRLSDTEGEACALWWAWLCERDFGDAESSPKRKNAI